MTALEEAFARAPVAIVLVDRDGTPVHVNDAFCSVSGYPAEALLQMSLGRLIGDGDAVALQPLVDGRVAELRLKTSLLCADGVRLPVLLAASRIARPDGAGQYVVAHLLDISEQQTLERRLTRLADHDALTELVNRRHFEEELARRCRPLVRHETPGALVVFDLDRFKQINDRFGHQEGDRVLRSVAAGVRDRFGGSHTVARLGGDEFAILLPFVAGPDAEAVADAVLDVVRETIQTIGQKKVRLTASVGLAPIGEGDPETLLKRADAAMYEAKRVGGNRWRWWQQAPRVGRPASRWVVTPRRTVAAIGCVAAALLARRWGPSLVSAGLAALSGPAGACYERIAQAWSAVSEAADRL
jgi:diguanylate cyclase (GGDEF)-like protein/PAS domain S-box-containing protein